VVVPDLWDFANVSNEGDLYRLYSEIVEFYRHVLAKQCRIIDDGGTASEDRFEYDVAQRARKNTSDKTEHTFSRTIERF
jgi:hypothetical protein